MLSTQLIRFLLKNNIKNNYSTAIVKQNVKSSSMNYWAISIQQNKSGSYLLLIPPTLIIKLVTIMLSMHKPKSYSQMCQVSLRQGIELSRYH